MERRKPVTAQPGPCEGRSRMLYPFSALSPVLYRIFGPPPAFYTAHLQVAMQPRSAEKSRKDQIADATLDIDRDASNDWSLKEGPAWS
ncbi:hypothetical protein M434DRAFT_32911 [Hypoxylon sp. CO27-5]|nr:hypothetical protein M434DRAFT_32911 [Hypoxylon sp. CO27-5]